ncbi:MAG: hypothetical protein J7L15_02600 [Clostridiales bacterium]|nr:hypothetical protein [Clostridiales bacterium]
MKIQLMNNGYYHNGHWPGNIKWSDGSIYKHLFWCVYWRIEKGKKDE